MAQSLEGLIQSLLECSGDKDDAVSDGICASLRTLGAHRYHLVLTTIHTHFARQSKMPATHRALLLSVIDKVCYDILNKMDDDLATLIINLATQEMTMAKDTDDEWQSNASSVLVTLSRRFCATVMDSLLQKFQPGCVPRPSILLTMGSVAVTNVFAFVPFLSDVISRTIPMLASVKQDMLKSAFTKAVRNYCESLCEYVSNIDEAPDPSVSKEVYATQVAAVYDVFITWIHSKDMKVRSAVVPCLGEMCHIIPKERVHEELKRLVSSMLNLYKKSSVDARSVTQGLCRLLEAAAADESCPIEPYLEEIWVALFPQVFEEVDYSSPQDAKNQNEVLRCFHVTATINADRLVYYLVQKMQSGQEKFKLGALLVLRHLINSSGPFLVDKRSLVIRGLQPVLQEGNTNKVKKTLCQLSVALADHTYLEADGGRLVIEFLVKNLIPPDENQQKKIIDTDPSSGIQLRGQCASALLTISRTSDQAPRLLWPYLFEFICVEPYSNAITDVCRCLSTLANRLLEQGTALQVESDSELENPRLPGRHQVLARLMVLLGGPVPEHTKRSLAVVQLMQALVSWINPAFTDLWQKELTLLRSQLEDMGTVNGGHIDGGKWETTVLRFLLNSVITISDGEWRSDLVAAFGKQFHLYNQFPDEKKFLCRCMGGILTKIIDVQFVLDHLELMFKAVTHSKAAERLGCAQAVGYCSSVHTDVVLTKLENIAKWEHQKKSGGIFGFLKTITENDVEMTSLRATIMLCYGYLVYYCSVDIVTQRLESTVLRFLKPYLENSKDVVVKECLIQTLNLISLSVHPSHLGAEYSLQERGQLLNHLKDYVHSESADSMTTNIRLLAAVATANLTKLDPPLSESEYKSICGVLAHNIYSLTSVKTVPQPFMDREVSIQSCVTALHDVYQEIIKKEPKFATLSALLKLIQPWFSSSNDHERERAFDSALLLLKCYYDNATDCVIGRATDFPMIGSAFGRFCPRFCDSVQQIRLVAMECVYWMLSLSVLHKGLGKDFGDASFNGILEYKSQLTSSDLQTQLQIVTKLADVIEQKLPPKQMQTYLSILFEIVLDKQTGVSCASAVLLQRMLTVRGPQLQAESEKIVSTILEKLPEMESVQTYAEALQSLQAFAYHHLGLVMSSLLKQTLPFSQSVVDCWHTLARGDGLLSLILNQLIKQMAECDEMPFEQPEGTNTKYASPAALAITAAFIEVVKGGEPEEILMKEFPRLLSAILIHCGSLVETQYPFTSSQIYPELRRTIDSPGAMVHVAIKTLLMRARTDKIILHLNEVHVWNDFEHHIHFATAISEIGKAIAQHYPSWVRPLVDELQMKMESPRDCQRIVATSVISSFVKRYPGNDGKPDAVLLALLVNQLVRGLADANITVRKLSVRGLGDLAHVEAGQLELYTTTALSAIMAGLEDPGDHKDEVALEAMQGLNKLSARISRSHMDNILVSVLLRIKPCFDKESGALRAVAFSLFGELASFGDCDAYKEQIHSNIVPLLLHLNDEEPEVQKACVRVFHSIERHLHCEQFTQLIKEQLRHSDFVHDYRGFAKEFSKILTRAYSDRVNFYALCCANYFKSGVPRIRANAALLIGYLLGGAPPDLRSTISKELIFSGLALLLKEPETNVKLCVAEAIAGLYDY